MCPNPSAPSIRTARAFLSNPAASPSGLLSGSPASDVCRRGSLRVNALPAARRTSDERPPSSDAASVRLCARSASSRNSSGRTADS